MLHQSIATVLHHAVGTVSQRAAHLSMYMILRDNISAAQQLLSVTDDVTLLIEREYEDYCQDIIAEWEANHIIDEMASYWGYY